MKVLGLIGLSTLVTACDGFADVSCFTTLMGLFLLIALVNRDEVSTA